MGIKTASIDLADPMPIEDDIILSLYEQFASADEMTALKEKYQAGGFGYGGAKKQLLETLLDFFAKARARREELANSPKVDEIMAMGAEKARIIAKATMAEVYEKTGLA
jgi:tryptophanyl-tRNA synthetase